MQQLEGQEIKMFNGVIRTKEILLNPGAVIEIHGLKGFLRLLGKGLSWKKYQFIDFLEITKKTLLPRESTPQATFSPFYR